MTAEVSEVFADIVASELTEVDHPVEPAVLVISEFDHALINRARRAFRDDFRYLEQVIWAARQRLGPVT
jgi:MoxR-like ATPase